MTKTNTRKRINPYPIILGIILVGVIAFVVVKLLADHSKPTDNQHVVESTNITANATNTTDTTSSNTSKSPEKEESVKKNTTQYDGEDPNTKESLTGNITTSRISGDSYIIRLNIDQYLTSGTCQLTFTDGEVTHTDTANISSIASSSTCEGFDIPLKALASGHTYNIYIDLSSSDGRAGRITGEAKL